MHFKCIFAQSLQQSTARSVQQHDPVYKRICSLNDQENHLCLAAEAVGGDPKLRSTNQEVAQLLEQVAALGEDTGEADLTPPSGPAPNRFAAAVLASVEAAGSAKAAETRLVTSCPPAMRKLHCNALHINKQGFSSLAC